jgi:hypothetical protein
MALELRRLGLEVSAADLYAYADPLIRDIATNADVFKRTSLTRETELAKTEIRVASIAR